MIQAFDVTETREYSLAADKSDPRTIFTIGYLDSALQAYLNDHTIAFRSNGRGPDALADVNVNTNMRLREIVKFGVKGWKNFKDRSGNDLTFDTVSVPIGKAGNRMGLTDRCLDALKPYISELAKQIESASWLTQEEVGSFGSPSQGS